MITQTNNVPFDVLLGPYGLVAFLLFFVILGGIRKWWVWGWQYEELQRDKDEWKAIALRGTGVTEKAADALQTAVESSQPNVEEAIRVAMEEVRRRGLIQ